MIKERDAAIDFLKCIAVLCIFNAHSTMLYPVFPWLSTGGYVGDALFFFCSGYTLFLNNGARLIRFDSWYKRRLGRIWPSCLAWGGLAGLFSLKDISIIAAFSGVEWFMKWILIYYILMWCIGKVMIRYLGIVFVVSMLASICGLLYMKLVGNTDFWGPTYFFPLMVLGAIMGMKNEGQRYGFSMNCFLAIMSFAFFTGLIALGTRLPEIAWTKYVPVFCSPVLAAFLVFAYRAASSASISSLKDKKLIWQPVLFIGGLCMDFYLIKATFITDKLNFLFPLNLPLVLAYLLFIAYVLRSVGRLIQQTIIGVKEPYDWRAAFALI